MGTNTLTDRSNGQTIDASHPNAIHQAMSGDFVGRNSSGVPTSGQSLGTAAFPWGSVYADGIVLDGSSVDTSQITSPQNRVISGKVRTTSNQPAFITPNGAAASFILAAGTTNLVVDINGTQYTVTTNITKSSLTTAPSSNNTCLVDSSIAADQDDTKYWGEFGHSRWIPVDTMGTEISALVGKFAAFKIAGTTDEYFWAYVESTTKLSKCMRGYFYNSSLAPVNRAGFTNNDTITLMKTGWVFIDDDVTTVDVSYTNPTWSYTSPTSPATGDYWLDFSINQWKRYDGASWVIIGRTLVGMVIMDSSNCVAARCVDFYAKYARDNTVELEVDSNPIIRGMRSHMYVSVAGHNIQFGSGIPTWNMTTDLATSADMYNATEQASTKYYLYVKDDGDTVISDIRPYWRPDLYGWYHPHNPWREIGAGYNDGSSNLVRTSARAGTPNSRVELRTGNGWGAVNTKIRRYTTVSVQTGTDCLYADTANDGASVTITEPGTYEVFYADGRSGAADRNIGVTVNSSELTTAISSVTEADRLLEFTSGNDGGTATATRVRNFEIGDVIRAHDAGDTTSNFGGARLKVCRVANLIGGGT